MNAETAAAGSTQRAARPGVVAAARYLAMATAALWVVQFALAGYGAFGGSFGPHRAVGSLIGLVTLVLLIVVAVAGVRGRLLWVALGLFVLAGPLQPIFAALGKNDGAAFGGLHALGGLGVGALAGMLIGGLRPVRP